jgi:hypothetical protein
LGLVRLCARPGSMKGGVVALPLRRLAWLFAVRHALPVKWCLPLPVKHALPFTVGVACHFWWCCLATICVCASRTAGSWLGLCCFRCASRFRSRDAASSVQVAPSTYGQADGDPVLERLLVRLVRPVKPVSVASVTAMPVAYGKARPPDSFGYCLPLWG